VRFACVIESLAKADGDIISDVMKTVTAVLDLFTLNCYGSEAQTPCIFLNSRKKALYFYRKNLHNRSHQRPSVKLKMHQNKSWLGLCPRPHWGSLQRSPRPPSWIINYWPFGPPTSALWASTVSDSSFWFSNVGLYVIGHNNYNISIASTR